MAYAELAGLSPVNGLYALLLPTVAYALLGSSRRLVVGPEGSIAATGPWRPSARTRSTRPSETPSQPPSQAAPREEATSRNDRRHTEHHD
jgi:Sulfate permease family